MNLITAYRNGPKIAQQGAYRRREFNQRGSAVSRAVYLTPVGIGIGGILPEFHKMLLGDTLKSFWKNDFTLQDWPEFSRMSRFFHS